MCIRDRVSDNGRGIPVDIQPKLGIPAVTVVYTVLHEMCIRDRHIPVFNQRPHVTEEEGQHQGADVGAVNVSISHDKDFVVPHLVDCLLYTSLRVFC